MLTSNTESTEKEESVEISTMMTTDHIMVEERNEKMKVDYMELKNVLYFKVAYCMNPWSKVLALSNNYSEYCGHIDHLNHAAI